MTKEIHEIIDNVLKKELDKIKHAVIKKDRDYVMVIDGEEGSGKSVLAMQIAKYFDPNFDLDNICFNSDQFIDRLKKSPKFACVLLDEAYSSANARASITEVNRSLVGVSTEMRQQNLFVILVIPSFFDLDRHFALWRCRSLLHVYFRKDGSRGSFIIFPKTQKKYLYLNGKKFYDYSKPISPFPACSFPHYYPIDEMDYRKKKSMAFKSRVVSNLAKRWKHQRDSLVKELYHNHQIITSKFEKIFLNWGTRSLSQREIQRIVQLESKEDSEEYDDEENTSNKPLDASHNPKRSEN